MDELPPQFGIEAHSPYLPQPITKKNTIVSRGKIAGTELPWAMSSMQGWRVTMEDAHAHDLPIKGLKDTGYFGVFDGHGGDLAAKYAAANSLKYIEQSDAFGDLKRKNASRQEQVASVLEKAIREGFVDCDESMRELPEVESGQDYSGSTGVCCMITESHLIFGNTGDSRAVLFSNNKVKFATQDQKPEDPQELARVQKAGGHVQDGRVNGDLASARSFGDFRYKQNKNLSPEKQQITVYPETTIVPRSDQDQYLVIACDGIWDVMSNFECTQFILAAMKAGCGLGAACERVLDECLEKSSGDNMSIMIICFPAGQKEIGKAKPGREPKLAVIREAMIDAVI